MVVEVGEAKILCQLIIEPDTCPILSCNKTSDVVQLENLFCFRSVMCESFGVGIIEGCPAGNKDKVHIMCYFHVGLYLFIFLTFIVPRDHMLVSKNTLEQVWHAIHLSLCVCLVGVSINLHTKPQKLMPSRDTVGYKLFTCIKIHFY